MSMQCLVCCLLSGSEQDLHFFCYLPSFVLILLFKLISMVMNLCYPGQCQSGVENVIRLHESYIQVDISTITIMLVLALLAIKLMFSVQIPHNYRSLADLLN